MKKCIVVTRFARTQPGYLDFAYRIRSLAKRYKVVMLSDHVLSVPEMQIEGVDHVVLPCGESTAGWLRYLWLAARYIRRERPAVVMLLHTMTAPLTYFLNRAPHALYWNEHPTRVKGFGNASPLRKWYREGKYRYLFINAARKADLIMPIGEAHYDDLVDQGCDPARLRLIYMGVDERFAGVALNCPEANRQSGLRLVYTGSVEKARGRDVMLEAIAKSIGSGIPVHLTIVGAVPAELDYCNSFARKLGIESAIRVVGRVSGTQIPDFIAGADAGICIWEDRPWWRFNPPTKLFEYLVAGLPVLASNIRTHTQYVRNWDNGIIFEYDSDSLAGAIQELWSRGNELARLKQRAYESSKPYLWSAIEPKFMAAIDSLARSSR